MTKTQQQYYLAIRELDKNLGRFPTFQEIADKMCVRALATIHKQVHLLVARGYVTKEYGGKGFMLVPQKLHGMETCCKGHEPIWFMGVSCPLCLALARIPTLSSY